LRPENELPKWVKENRIISDPSSELEKSLEDHIFESDLKYYTEHDEEVTLIPKEIRSMVNHYTSAEASDSDKALIESLVPDIAKYVKEMLPRKRPDEPKDVPSMIPRAGETSAEEVSQTIERGLTGLKVSTDTVLENRERLQELEANLKSTLEDIQQKKLHRQMSGSAHIEPYPSSCSRNRCPSATKGLLAWVQRPTSNKYKRRPKNSKRFRKHSYAKKARRNLGQQPVQARGRPALAHGRLHAQR